MLVGEYVCVLIICLGDAVASIYLRHPPLSIHSGSINLCSSASLVTRPGFSFKVPRSLSTIIVYPPVHEATRPLFDSEGFSIKNSYLGSMQETYFLLFRNLDLYVLCLLHVTACVGSFYLLKSPSLCEHIGGCN